MYVKIKSWVTAFTSSETLQSVQYTKFQYSNFREHFSLVEATARTN